MEATTINTFNKFLVGVRGDEIAVTLPIPRFVSKDDALLLAAYLVTFADPGRERFDRVLEAVQS